jgi:hypothetical protein
MDNATIARPVQTIVLKRDHGPPYPSTALLNNACRRDLSGQAETQATLTWKMEREKNA